MRKSIKYSIYACLIMLLMFININHVYAVLPYKCDSDFYNNTPDGKDCPVGRVDATGHVCSLHGPEGYRTCASTSEDTPKTCEQFDTSNGEVCPSVDHYENNACGLTKEGKCVTIRKASKCGEGIYTGTNCAGVTDDFGNTCQTVYNQGVKCVISKELSITDPIPPAKEIKNCTDMHVSYCSGRDSYGNLCAPKYNTTCEIAEEASEEIKPSTTLPSSMYNGPFECSEYFTDNGKRSCPIVDSYKNACLVGTGGLCYATGRTLDFTYEEYYHIEEGKSANDVKLIESDEAFTCSDVSFLTSIWLIMRVAAPFLVILFGSLDFIKAIITNDEKAAKTARGKFVKRLIATLLLIILPFIIQFIFETLGTFGSERVCLLRCIATNDTSEKGCD